MWLGPPQLGGQPTQGAERADRSILTEGDAVDTSKIRATIRECDRKLDRYRQLLEAGTDPAVVAGWIRDVTAQRVTADAALAAANRKAAETTTPEEIRQELEAFGGLLQLLDSTDPELKARFYETVGLEGTYDPATRVVTVEARVLNGRVGGPTRTRGPRPLAGESPWSDLRRVA